MVADDYIKVVIKEIHVSNQDVIPPDYDVWFSQVYVTNCFINDERTSTHFPLWMYFKFGTLCQTWGIII